MFLTTTRTTAAVTGAAMLLVAGVTEVADAGSAARYEGQVTGGGPVSFRTTKSTVPKFAATLTVLCVNGEGAGSRTETYAVMPRRTPKLSRSGAFSFAYDLSKEQGTGEDSADVRNAVKAAVTGRVRGSSASGTAKVSYTKLEPLFSGGSMRFTIMLCSSGERPLTWTAKRK